ncbi:haloacid dehalogenase [Cellulomonas chitinilytica]|uniref:Haloacid dehalogenase n=1 Tax=Cellulomonas chitinilytica TaxID=398759 RepID=A0A919P6V7_9CELL|nr:HAD hydrolase family protein [Cellulomonas chitinilytica]GIG23222.1 haloacid dehalogenase [Cellulomonas chitinilytica]
MSRCELVALDVDGTLMSYDGVVSDEVRAAVLAVRDSGRHVVLATGRSAHSAVPVAHALGLTDGWLVASNGAVTVRLDPDADGGHEIHKVVTFDAGPAIRTIAMELPDALFAVEALGTGFRVSGDFPDGELSGRLEVVPFDELAATPATRVVIRAPGASPDLFHELVERVGLHEVEYAVGWSAWLDLTPGGVSKASALEEIRRTVGVEPFATVAVGDGSNDAQMLRWAARGVAMGHATQAVRDSADEVTGTIEDDGAVAVLRSLLV